jgi:DNA-binding NarL/FixJ family response regulator
MTWSSSSAQNAAMDQHAPHGGPVRLVVGGISQREMQVLDLIAAGLSNRAIAEDLALSERGVEKHVTTLYRKFHIPPDARIHRRIRLLRAYQQLTDRA